MQQETLGRRGRAGDPLHGIRNMLRAGAERLTDKQRARLEKAIAADEAHLEVDVAWVVRPAAAGGLPPPEIKRLGRTLRQWSEAFLAYFDTGRS